MSFTKLVFTIAATLLFATSPSFAEQQDPPLFPLTSSTPELAAFQAWHKAVLSRDYEAYKRVSAAPEGLTPELQKQLFENYVKAPIPVDLKTTAPAALPNGRVQFHAIGCTGGMRQVARISVYREGPDYRVMVFGFEPPWNNKSKSCPV